MDNKYSFPYLSMFKEFFVQFKTLKELGIVLAIFCAPPAFFALVYLTVLMFFRSMVSSIFKLPIDYVENRKNDKTAYRVALLIVLSPFFFANFVDVRTFLF